LKASKMSTLRAGLAIKHIASHKCRISSFEKGKSSVHSQACGSTIGNRRRAHCKQSAPVRSHHAAFFHIRQQRWFGRLRIVLSPATSRRYAARMPGRDRICFTEFSNRRLKRFAARDDHRRSMKFSSSRMLPGQSKP